MKNCVKVGSVDPFPRLLQPRTAIASRLGGMSTARVVSITMYSHVVCARGSAAVNAPHEGKRKVETLWPIHQINNQRT